MSKLNRTERIIFWLCAAVFCTFSYFLYDDSIFFTSTEEVKNKDIGIFNISKNDVRRKSEENFLWTPASISDKVYLRDSIFTGDSSYATLKFSDGSTIEVKENSMITLNMTQGQIQLDLKYGDLITDLKEKSNIEVSLDSQKFDLKPQNSAPSKVQIQKTRTKQLKVKLLEGNAQFTNKKNNENVNLVKEKQLVVAPQKVNVAQSQNVPPPVKIIETPALQPKINLVTGDKYQFSLSEIGNTFSLNWTARDIKSFKVILSTKPDFLSNAVEKNTELNSVDIQDKLAAGWYFWRVIGQDENGKELIQSEIRRIFISYLELPQFTTPSPEQVFNFEAPAPANDFATEVALAWNSRSKYLGYEIQVADNDKFDNPIISSASEGLTLKTTPLKAGKYYSRLRGKITDNKYSPWTTTLSWTIYVNEKKAIALELINKNINFNPSQIGRNPSSLPNPIISWRKYPEAKKYLVEISRTPDFKEKIESETQNLQFKWNKYQLGNHFYRVTAKDSKSVLAKSELGTVKVSVSNPELKPAQKIQVRSDQAGSKAPAKSVPLSWTQVPFANKYILEVDKNPDFKKAIKKEVKTTSSSINLTEPGKYHARVIAYDSSQPITGYSNVQPIVYNYSARLSPPNAEEPRNKVNIFLQQDIEPLIWLVWVKDTKAINYEIQVATDPEFSKMLINEKNVKDSRFLIKTKIPIGPIYWRVKAVAEKPDETSSWSESRVFTLITKKNENTFQ